MANFHNTFCNRIATLCSLSPFAFRVFHNRIEMRRTEINDRSPRWSARFSGTAARRTNHLLDLHSLRCLFNGEMLHSLCNFKNTIRRLTSASFCQALRYIGRTANIEPMRALTLKDINGRHLRRLVDLVGIEPTTSSMPWKRAPKLRHRPTGGQLSYCLRLQSNRQTAARVVTRGIRPRATAHPDACT